MSYLTYFQYFNVTKNSQAGFFEAKSRRILTISVWNFCVYRIWNSLYGVRKGRYPCTCKENQWTFLELLVTKARTVVVVDEPLGPWMGPSNNGNKQPKTLKWVMYTKYAKYVKYVQYKISFIDVFYHQIRNGIQGCTTRAPPLSRAGWGRTGDQTIASPMPWR
jgi:hypothetical protein